MPLPLLIPIGVGLSGLIGGALGIKAAIDNKNAKEIVSDANSLIHAKNKTLDTTREATNACLEHYGRKKLDVLTRDFLTFVTLFEQIKRVEIKEGPELHNLQVGNFTQVHLAEMKNDCELAATASLGLASGSVGGALAGFGAYSGTMMLASAGTGTAISTLSGAAATKATLAWLGGGTLASGGLGVAGGTLVLGTMVAGPALLIFGSVMGFKASEKLDEARSDMEKARTYAMEVDGICQKLTMIAEVTNQAETLLSQLRGRFRRANEALRQTIQNQGTDYQLYPEKDRNNVLIAVKFAQLLKTVVDTPILNEDGGLCESSSGELTRIEESMKNISRT